MQVVRPTSRSTLRCPAPATDEIAAAVRLATMCTCTGSARRPCECPTEPRSEQLYPASRRPGSEEQLYPASRRPGSESTPGTPGTPGPARGPSGSNSSEGATGRFLPAPPLAPSGIGPFSRAQDMLKRNLSDQDRLKREPKQLRSRQAVALWRHQTTEIKDWEFKQQTTTCFVFT